MTGLQVALVALDQAVERLPMDEIDDLGENKTAGVHAARVCGKGSWGSNPSHPFFVLSHSLLATCDAIKSL